LINTAAVLDYAGVRGSELPARKKLPTSLLILVGSWCWVNATTEKFLEAIADAMREEYRAIVDAGFILQLDDPGLPGAWDMLDPQTTATPPVSASNRNW
jgi:methionine synthase II (cobalamin-independent)